MKRTRINQAGAESKTSLLLGKDLTKISDLSPKLVEEILTRASNYKAAHDKGIRRENVLHGHVIALLFEKPSLRTKVAFEVAAAYLGGTPVFLSSSQILASGGNQRGRESIPDIARNLERFADVIVARVYSHSVIEELATSISIPVVNALCDGHHPTQALADLMTLRTFISKTPNRSKVAFIGDGNNVATSLMQICAMMGYNFILASPKGFEVKEQEIAVAQEMARNSGATIEFSDNPKDAIKGSDAVYTDTFVSMGQEDERDERLKKFKGFRVDAELMKLASPDAIFMHCLPAHREEEVTDEVMDSDYSVVFDQAECRLHIAKALLSLVLVGV